MKTILLHLQDDYTWKFQAKVVSASRDNLVLDRTAFYPTGGHQACDLGRIVRGAEVIGRVIDVTKTGPVVNHKIDLISGSLAEGDDVECEIDWERRYCHMRLHTAQHIFSKCFLAKFEIDTWRSDLSVETGLIVLDVPVTTSQVVVAESETNEVIQRGLEVHRVMRGDRAFVCIGEFSQDECAGTHVRDTSEIGVFKVYRIDEKKVYYQVGGRAIDVAFRMANCSLEADKLLGLDGFQQIPGKLSHIMGEFAAQQRTINELQERTTQLQVEKALATSQQAEGIEVLSLDLSHLHSKTAKRVISSLHEEGRVILCIADNNSELVKISPAHLTSVVILP